MVHVSPLRGGDVGIVHLTPAGRSPELGASCPHLIQAAGLQCEHQSKKRKIRAPKGPTGTGICGQYPTRDRARRLLSTLPYDLTSGSLSFPSVLCGSPSDGCLHHLLRCLPHPPCSLWAGRERWGKEQELGTMPGAVLHLGMTAGKHLPGTAPDPMTLPRQHGTGVPAFS